MISQKMFENKSQECAWNHFNCEHLVSILSWKGIKLKHTYDDKIAVGWMPIHSVVPLPVILVIMHIIPFNWEEILKMTHDSSRIFFSGVIVLCMCFHFSLHQNCFEV